MENISVNNEHLKIESVINSCDNPTQIESCFRMIKTYRDRYNNISSVYILLLQASRKKSALMI